MPTIHDTDLNRNRHGLASYNHATDLGYVQATAAPTDYASMRAAILALTGLQEGQQRELQHIVQNLDVCKALGILTDQNCAQSGGGSSANDAAVRAIFTTVDPTLPAAFRSTFAFRG